jgi:nucleoside-diphosphate-sugar epimerase
VTQKMRVLVTGSAGHLGEALVRTLKSLKQEVVGLDILESPFTTQCRLDNRPLLGETLDERRPGCLPCSY